MLSVLKEQLRSEDTVQIIMESSDDSIRDRFLDGLDEVVLGAENDSSLNSVIENIPEYDGTDPEFAKEVEALTESTLIFDI